MTEVAERTGGTPVTGPDEVVRLDAVRKVYGGPKRGVAALDGVTLGLGRGTFTAVMGGAVGYQNWTSTTALTQ